MAAQDWTDEDVAYLSKNWGSMSGSQIAAVIGKSRGAVIGKASRLGFRKRVPGVKKSAPRFFIETGVGIDNPREPFKRVEPNLQCMFIEGDPLDRGIICGAPAERGAWCNGHYHRVYKRANQS